MKEQIKTHVPQEGGKDDTTRGKMKGEGRTNRLVNMPNKVYEMNIYFNANNIIYLLKKYFK